MFGRRPSRAAEAFDAALGSKPLHDEQAELLDLAASLSELGAAPAAPAGGFERGRQMLHAELRAERTSARRAPAVRLRAGAMGVAAVAGAGVLVASAATTTNPIVLVRDTVADLPGVTDSRQESLVFTELTGTVTQVTNDRVEVDLGDGDLLTVRLREGTVLRLEDGTLLTADSVEPGQRIAIETETHDGETTIRPDRLTVLAPNHQADRTTGDEPSDAVAPDDPGANEPEGDRRNFVANPNGSGGPPEEAPAAAGNQDGATDQPPTEPPTAAAVGPDEREQPRPNEDPATAPAGTNDPGQGGDPAGADGTQPPAVATPSSEPTPTERPTRPPATGAANSPPDATPTPSPTPTPNPGGNGTTPHEEAPPVDVFTPDGTSVGHNNTAGGTPPAGPQRDKPARVPRSGPADGNGPSESGPGGGGIPATPAPPALPPSDPPSGPGAIGP